MRLADLPMDERTRELWAQHKRLCFNSAVMRGRKYGVEWRDLLGSAFQGWLMATHKWRPDGGRQYQNYVFAMIRRMVFDFLKHDAHHWRHKIHHMKVVALSLDELEELGLPPQRDSRFHPYHSEDEFFAAIKEQFVDDPQQLWDLLMEERDERERFIITCQFRQHMPFKEIGPILGISKQRVEQIFSRAMRRIRERALLIFADLLRLFEYEPGSIPKYAGFSNPEFPQKRK